MNSHGNRDTRANADWLHGCLPWMRTAMIRRPTKSGGRSRPTITAAGSIDAIARSICRLCLLAGKRMICQGTRAAAVELDPRGRRQRDRLGFAVQKLRFRIAGPKLSPPIPEET